MMASLSKGPLLRGFAAALACLLLTANAVAQQAPDDDVKERARILYERAADAYAKKRNFEAIELFKAAAALTPNPLFSHNIAVAYEDLGDVRNALRYYREFLRSAEASVDRGPDEERVAKLEARLGELGVQQLTIMSRPSQAIAFVDDVPVGVTPWTGELVPGAHQVRVESAGHRPARAEVNLPQHRSAELLLELSPQAEPPGAGATAPAAVQDESPKMSLLGRVKPLSWALLGTGAGSLGGALFFELSRASSARRAESAGNAVDEARARGAADAKQSASLLLFGVGGAFTVAGGILTVLDLVSEPHSRARTNARRALSFSAACAPGSFAATATGRF